MRLKIFLYLTFIAFILSGTLSAQRVTDSLVVLYRFNEGSGSTINDVSGYGTALNLQIEDTDSVTWQPETGSLRIDGSTALQSSGAATKLYNALTATDEFTIEAWITPSQTSYPLQTRRIISYANTTGDINFALRQIYNATRYEGRVDLTLPPSNGDINLESGDGTVTTDLTHVVFTRDAAGDEHMYVDNTPESTVSPLGSLSNWTSTDSLALGNTAEFPSQDRVWLGEFHLVAIYNRALNTAEIDSNFTAGPDAEANISPLSVIRNQGLVQFTYTIEKISSLSPEIGAVDKVSIANPFTADSMFVSSVTVDGTPYYILNSATPPTSSGFATWEYDTATDSLHIRTDDLEIIDDIVIEFFVNVPDTMPPSPYLVNFPSRIDAISDSDPPYSIDPGNYSVEILPSSVAYYTFTPSTPRSLIAGDPGLSYLIQSRDEFGNTTANNDSVYLTAIGGNFVEFVEGTTLGFGGGSSLSVTVKDSVVETFTVRAQSNINPDIMNQSSLVTVEPSVPDQIIVFSDTTQIVVRGQRQIQIRVEDTYGNPVADTSVTFTATQGNGYFSAPGDQDTTISTFQGIIQVPYTASDNTVLGKDSIHIQVDDDATALTMWLRLRPDNVSYYTFTPANDTSFTAGDSLQFILTARDQYGNGVINSNQIALTTVGSDSATIDGGSTPSFSNDSTLTITVRDTVAENFTIRADSSQISGQSGLITVNPNTADHYVILSSSDPIVVRGERLLRVAVEDTFNNPINNQLVLFKTFGGNGYFGTTDNFELTVSTNQLGIAEALYTASDSLSFISDTIRIELGVLEETIILPLQAGNITNYTFVPSADTSFTAGDPAGLDLTITARDQYGNGVVNSNQITLTAVGASGATFNPSATPSFSNNSSMVIKVTDNIAESFTVRADSATISGQSGLITVNPGAPDHLVVLSDTSQVVVGGQRLIQVALEDANNNRVDSSLTFTAFEGNGYFSVPGDQDTTISTTNGIVEVPYTASSNLILPADSILIQVQNDPGTELTMWLRLQAGNVSYYTFSPNGPLNVTAGVNQPFTLTARDQYGNGVENGDDVTLSAFGGTSVNI